MARQPRIHYPGAIFHVMARGNGGQKLFLDDSYYQAFLGILESVKKERPFELFSWCLMPNHFHTLMRVDEFRVSVVMQRILLRFAKFFNIRRRRFGHVFQGRFKAVLCEKDPYLLELPRYIHLNPVRAGLVKDPADWPWSGHRAFLGLPEEPAVTDLAFPLSVFNEDPWRAQQLYAKFVENGARLGHRKEFYPPTRLPCLGSKAFIRRFEDRFDYVPPRRRLGAGLAELSRQVLDALGAARDLLFSRRRAASPVKREFILKAREAGHTSVQIAAFLRCTPSAISHLIEPA